jgi:hypothetical protein
MAAERIEQLAGSCFCGAIPGLPNYYRGSTLRGQKWATNPARRFASPTERRGMGRGT